MSRLSRRVPGTTMAQPGELVGDEVVVGDAAASAEVFWIGAGMDGTARRHETDAVGRGHLATSPDVGDRQSVLCRHDFGVGRGDGLGPDEVLADPGKPGTAERWLIGADHRLEADIAGLRDQRTTEAGRCAVVARLRSTSFDVELNPTYFENRSFSSVRSS